MIEYCKINTLFKRDEKTHKIIEGNWSIPEFEYLKDNLWFFEEKIDGTNIRIYWDGKELKYGGRTDNAQIPVTLHNRLDDIFKKQIDYFRNTFAEKEVLLFGEGYGKKIQSGHLYTTRDADVDFCLFDVKIGKWWLDRENVIAIANDLKLRKPESFEIGVLQKAIDIVRCGFKSAWCDLQAEGLVLRPTLELKTRRGDRVIAKLKTRDFELEVKK
jgi:ATP-dependent RNA circularization protein (DNA/RNA ligase family)